MLFRSQGPSVSEPAPVKAVSRSMTLDFSKAPSGYYGSKDAGYSVSGGSSSFLSSVTGDGSVSNGRVGGGSSSLMLPPPPSASCGKPPLASGAGAGPKRKCHDHAHSENVAGAAGGRCHCSKRRFVFDSAFSCLLPQHMCWCC